MASSSSRFAAWSTAIKQTSKNVVKTQSRAARNDHRLVGRVVYMFKKTVQQNNASTAASSGSASSSNNSATKKPRYDIHVRLGSLRNNPDVTKVIVGAEEKLARVFPIENGKSMNDYTGAPASKDRSLFSYEILRCSINEEELANAGGVEVGDLVELRGINFSNWYTKPTNTGGGGFVTVYCNIDKIERIPGAERNAFGYDLEFEAQVPVQRLALEVGTGNEGIYKAKLGRNYYTLNYFGTDGKRADAYLERPEYEIYRFDFEPKVDPENPQRHIVTYRPDSFNKEQGSGFIVENGFKTIATGTQHFADGSEQNNLAWIKLRAEHVAPLNVSDETTWTNIGPRILEQSKYSLLVRENLEKTDNEAVNHAGHDEDGNMVGGPDDDAGEGVDFKLVGSVQTMLINLSAEIERLGVAVPPERIQELMGSLVEQTKGADAMIASPLFDRSYQARQGRNMVIALNEWKGNLSELIARGTHDFYIVSNMQLDEDARELLNAEPVDKHYLLFDAVFKNAVNKAKGTPAKLEVAKKYGLSEDTEMLQLLALGNTATTRMFYAVLKPAKRVSDLLGRSIFVEAVRMYVPDPEATLERLRAQTLGASAPAPAPAPAVNDEKGGTKRAAPTDEAGDEATRPAAKRAKKDAQSDAPSGSDADPAGVASPKRGRKKGQ